MHLYLVVTSPDNDGIYVLHMLISARTGKFVIAQYPLAANSLFRCPIPKTLYLLLFNSTNKLVLYTRKDNL